MTSVYCSTADVRAITNLSTSEITNAEIASLIDYATYEINSDIGVTLFVDTAAIVGTIDGSNTSFHLRTAPIGDLDNDGSVGVTDIQMWSKSSSADHYTTVATPVASIDDDEMGNITFSNAPDTSHDYIIKYVWFPIPYDSNLIKKACAELTAYLCFLKTNLKDVSSYRLGKLSVSKTARHPDLVNFYDRYVMTLGRIRGKTLLRGVTWELAEKMSEELEERLSYSGPGIPQVYMNK